MPTLLVLESFLFFLPPTLHLLVLINNSSVLRNYKSNRKISVPKTKDPFFYMEMESEKIINILVSCFFSFPVLFKNPTMALSSCSMQWQDTRRKQAGHSKFCQENVSVLRPKGHCAVCFWQKINDMTTLSPKTP